MNAAYMLTTIDNPFDPFTQFEDWYHYDEMILGYHSCSYLARIAKTSDKFTDKENDDAVERAIDEIVKYDPANIYTKVKNPSI